MYTKIPRFKLQRKQQDLRFEFTTPLPYQSLSVGETPGVPYNLKQTWCSAEAVTPRLS